MPDKVQPIFIMPQDSRRSQGRDAQRNNILAAKLVAETVRTTLGPKGMDKMLVDELGNVTVTNDGVTILKEMTIEHPTAKMIVEIANTQEEEVGDGTTTAVVLAGELLKKAESLLEMGLHPTMIIKGYRIASKKAISCLLGKARPVSSSDHDILYGIAETAMTGKGTEQSKERLSKIVVDAVASIVKARPDGRLDREDIQLEKRVGKSIEDTELVRGICLDREKLHPDMPEQIEEAKVALLNCPIEIRETETDARIQISDPEQMQAFLEVEEKMILKIVNRIRETGARFVACQKGVDEAAAHLLAKRGILVVRRVKKSDMERLSRATGAKVVNSIEELSAADIGKAGKVRIKKIGNDDMVFIEECPNPMSVTILVRGSTEQVIDEIERAISDAIGDVVSAISSKKAIAGAGAPEIMASLELSKHARSLTGREQLAVKAFAEALEIIPRTLAENSGLDPIEVLAKLKSAHEEGSASAGIDVFSGLVIDSWKQGIIEPISVKTQALSSATEVATMILRIDDVIASGKAPDPGEVEV